MVIATLRFSELDRSVGKDARGLFAFAAPKEVRDLEMPLYDIRADEQLVKGLEGLDTQGFALVNHQSALTKADQFFSGQNVEDIYVRETCDLVCRLTGASKAIIVNTAFRRKVVDGQKDPKWYPKPGEAYEEAIKKLPRDQLLVFGRENAEVSLEPARPAHVDYTAQGLQRTIRECRRDISEMAQHIIDAEDAQNRGEDLKVPRYAAYSVWRPLRTVQRDPLAVCDYRSIDKDELVKWQYRAVSEQNANGQYTMEYWHVNAPKDVKQPRWCYVPNQTPEEVLIIKFADTAAETDPSIARCCPHAAAVLPDTQDREPRSSIECRVLAFWD